MRIQTVQWKKRTDEPYSTENSRNCFNSFYSLYTGLWSDKNDETCRTHAKKYLNSICLQIQVDYLTFLFVCMSALMIINKIVLVVH